MQKISRTQYGLQQQILQTIYRLRDKKSSELFREPVDRNVVKDYYDKIQNPMDLQTVSEKLKQGKYKKASQVLSDLHLIISNCYKYNSQNAIVKKADQFDDCIKTEWANFIKQLDKKKIDIHQELENTEDIKKRLILVDQKKKKKKGPNQMLANLQGAQQPLDIPFIPRNSEISTMENKAENKTELPERYHFRPQRYSSLSEEDKSQKLQFTLNHEQIDKNFYPVSERKLKKYRKIMYNKIMWIEEKVIQRCLEKKRFRKMLIPNHLSNLINKGQIATNLQLRKIQMYVKQVAYWIQEYSHILSDKMKDKLVNSCRDIRRCIVRVLRYNKSFAKGGRFYHQTMDPNLASQAVEAASIQNIPFSHLEENPSVVNQSKFNLGENSVFNDDEAKLYETKMKEFRRMIARDRGESTKKDTRIVLKILDNGDVAIYDWSAQNQQKKTQKREFSSNSLGGVFKDTYQQTDKTKQNLQKKEQMKKDEEFLASYGKGSNLEVLSKYMQSLQIDWDNIILRKFKPTPLSKSNNLDQEFLISFNFESKTNTDIFGHQDSRINQGI